MIIVTETQRKNILSALEMWNTIPAEKVSWRLSQWRSESNRTCQDGLAVLPGCNTIACFGGWCAWHPEFMEQGLRGSRSGAPCFEDNLLDHDISYKLFGEPDMFDTRGYHTSDENTSDDESDWAIVQKRILWLIENSIVTT